MSCFAQPTVKIPKLYIVRLEWYNTEISRKSTHADTRLKTIHHDKKVSLINSVLTVHRDSSFSLTISFSYVPAYRTCISQHFIQDLYRNIESYTPGCPTLLRRVIRWRALGRSIWTSDSTVSWWNVIWSMADHSWSLNSGAFHSPASQHLLRVGA